MGGGGVHLKASVARPSPVCVEDGLHLGDVGLQRDGAELIQLLVIQKQVLVPETNELGRVKERS